MARLERQACVKSTETDIAPGLLSHAEGTTYCEFKGTAAYFDVVCPNGRVVRRAAWHFPTPNPGFEALVGHVAFYPGRLDRCTVDGEPAAGRRGKLRSRAVDIAYRKPSFAGDRVTSQLRLYESSDGLGAAGYISGDDGKPRVYVRVAIAT